MNDGRSTTTRHTLGVILGLNLAVGIMFTAVLFPHPPKQEYHSVATRPTSAKLTSLETRQVRSGIPARIIVPDVAIDMEVRVGSYMPESATWTIEYGAAFYADRTVPVNDNNGTTLIYGHADWAIFARITELTNGATAKVYTNEGHVFSYVFESNIQVQPDDVAVFNENGPPKLVLQTCSGPFDAYRTLVTFRLVGVEVI